MFGQDIFLALFITFTQNKSSLEYEKCLQKMSTEYFSMFLNLRLRSIKVRRKDTPNCFFDRPEASFGEHIICENAGLSKTGG